jgi:hypothetical protein
MANIDLLEAPRSMNQAVDVFSKIPKGIVVEKHYTDFFYRMVLLSSKRSRSLSNSDGPRKIP